MSLDSLNDTSGVETEADVIMGGGFKPLESDIYPMKVTMMYADESKGGATSLTIHAEGAAGKYRETIYVTSGRAKGGKPYYEKDGKKHFLPGYNIANAITLLTIGKTIGNAPHEPKTVNIYDYEAKKDLPQTREVYTSVIGQTVLVGIQQIIDDKNVNVADKGEKPDWQATGITYLKNEMKKVFRERDKLTVQEITAKVETAAFHDKWLDNNKGEVYDASIAKKGLVLTLPDDEKSSSGATTAESGEDENLFD